MIPNASILACSISLAVFLDVLVVQPGGPAGTFSDIQSACDQANERDTILVKTGTYPQFEVANKWLTIAADAGVSVNVSGGISVHDLAAGKRVTLIGLNSLGAPSTGPGFQDGLVLTSNQGSVRVQSCQLQGSYGAQFKEPGGDGVHIEHCSDVSLSHSSLLGGLGAYGYTGASGGAGLRLTQSSAAVYDCTLEGGHGADGVPPPWLTDGGEGGDGCHSDSSELFASHTTFRGGHGGDCAYGLGATTAGGGGDGLIILGGGIARLVSPTAIGGPAGQDPWGTSPGQPLAGGPIITLPVTFRSTMISPDPIRESTTLTITVSGQPGDKVGLALTPFTSSMFNAAWNGQQLFPAGTPFLRFGTIPTSGTLVQHMPIADLGPGVASRTYQMQALFSGTDGHRVLGTPVSLLVLDSAY
jgi:hypothetical protein